MLITVVYIAGSNKSETIKSVYFLFFYTIEKVQLNHTMWRYLLFLIIWIFFFNLLIIFALCLMLLFIARLFLGFLVFLSLLLTITNKEIMALSTLILILIT